MYHLSIIISWFYEQKPTYFHRFIGKSRNIDNVENQRSYHLPPSISWKWAKIYWNCCLLIPNDQSICATMNGRIFFFQIMFYDSLNSSGQTRDNYYSRNVDNVENTHSWLTWVERYLVSFQWSSWVRGIVFYRYKKDIKQDYSIHMLH